MSRWNGMNGSLRRNNLLSNDLDGLAGDLTFEDTTVETVSEQKEFDRLVREAGTADLSDGDEDDEGGVDDDELDEDDDEELDDEQDAADDDDIDARRRRSHSSDDDAFDEDVIAATSARAASGAFPRAARAGDPASLASAPLQGGMSGARARPRAPARAHVARAQRRVTRERGRFYRPFQTKQREWAVAHARTRTVREVVPTCR